MKIDSLRGAKVAIVALGGSYADYIAARLRSEEFDEVWGINSIGGVIHVDRTFMLDPVDRFLDTEFAGLQTKLAREFLATNTNPIYTCVLDERVPTLVEYPLEEVVRETGLCYFNNTVAYSLAFAVYQQVARLHLYGIDYSYRQNINFAEAGRACCEFWCATAISRGIHIEVAHRSGLLDTNVPENEKLYGYHRLDDPLVQKVENGSLLITRQSSIESPEATDGDRPEPVLFGRHDIEGVTWSKDDV